MTSLLDAKLDPHRHRSGGKDQINRAFHVSAFNARVPHPLVNRHVEQDLTDLIKPYAMRLQEGSILAAAAENQGENHAKQKGVSTRTQLQVQIRHLGDFGTARVDNQQMAARIALDLVDKITRVAKTVSEPGITAD